MTTMIKNEKSTSSSSRSSSSSSTTTRRRNLQVSNVCIIATTLLIITASSIWHDQRILFLSSYTYPFTSTSSTSSTATSTTTPTNSSSSSSNNTVITVDDSDVDNSIPYLNDMIQDASLQLSAKQQRYFFTKLAQHKVLQQQQRIEQQQQRQPELSDDGDTTVRSPSSTSSSVADTVVSSSSNDTATTTTNAFPADYNFSSYYSTNLGTFGFLPLGETANDSWMYRHIFKNGGTFVENEVIVLNEQNNFGLGMIKKKQKNKHISLVQVERKRQNRQHSKWIATVREPIEHFLSGWSECGERYTKLMIEKYSYKNSNKYRKQRQERQQQTDTAIIDYEEVSQEQWLQDTYNDRIIEWLHLIKMYLQDETSCQRHKSPDFNNLSRFRQNKQTTSYLYCLCVMHSIPQINYFIKPPSNSSSYKTMLDVEFFDNFVIVGDLKELSTLLPKFVPNIIQRDEYEKMRSNTTNTITAASTKREKVDRNSTTSQIKMSKFPKRLDLLSNTTIQALCDFLYLDYEWFDYDKPTVCV